MPDLAELDALFARVAAEYQQVQADQAELQRKLLDAQLDLLGGDDAQPAVDALPAPPSVHDGRDDSDAACPVDAGPSSATPADMVTHAASPRLPSPALSLAASPLAPASAASPDSLLNAMGQAMAQAQAARVTLGADVKSIGTPSSVGHRVAGVGGSPAASVVGSGVGRHISPELQRAMKANFSVSLMSWKLTETLQSKEALEQEVCSVVRCICCCSGCLLCML